MNLSTLLQCDKAFTSLMNQPLRGVVSYRLAKLSKQVKELFKDFNDTRETIFRKYAEEVDGEIKVDKDSESFKKIEAELTEVLEEEVNLDFKKIKVSDMVNTDISPNDFEMLSWLFEDDDAV